MTFGDIIEKFLGLFGVPPGNQRALSKRIKVLKKKIIEMEEDRNDKNRVISAIGEKIADLKRELQVESNPQTQDLIMDRIEEAEKDLERKKELSRQMGENITAQRAMRARLEQLLEQLRHGADPAEIEILMEKVVDMNDMRVEAGAKVTMTRTTDTEVSPKHRQATDVDELQARCDVANKAKADIFISIHMDSFTSREASGTTGYYYTKGSAASKRLAAAIQSELVGQLKTTSRGIKTCNFYVVKHTKMPATLIEVAFVSNPKEEKLLTSKKGVQKAAIGIVNGISDFFGE